MLSPLEHTSWSTELGIRKKHPSDVIRQARKIANNFDISKFSNNRQHVTWITIDYATSPDLDDGIHCEKLKNGKWYLLQVSIASPTEIIEQGSPIELEAFKRATSVYFGETHMYHMLPNIISTDISSLNHHCRRLALTLEMQINNDFEVVKKDIYPSIFFNEYRHDHESFLRSFSDTSSQWYETFAIMHELARWLRNNRENDLRITNFDDADRRIVLWEKINWHSNKHISSFIIQEFMILANVEKSKFKTQESIAGVFRKHMSDYSDGRPVPEVLERAEYSSTPDFHLGLWIPSYGHSTSPLRRNADFVDQRQMLAHLNWESPVYSVEEVQSHCDNINMEITRVISAQREELLDIKGTRMLRKSKTNTVWRSAVIQHIKHRNQYGLRIPGSIRKEIIRIIDEEKIIPEWILLNFSFWHEEEIKRAIRSKILEDTKVVKYMNILRNTKRIRFEEYSEKHDNIITFSTKICVDGFYITTSQKHQTLKKEGIQGIIRRVRAGIRKKKFIRKKSWNESAQMNHMKYQTRKLALGTIYTYLLTEK